MQCLNMIKQIVTERNLVSRISTEVSVDSWSFAYCVEDDKFVNCDVSYTDYVTKRFIVFDRSKVGEVRCGAPMLQHTPLLRNLSKSFVCKKV